MRRLLILPTHESPSGYPGFLAGYLDADEEIRRGGQVRLVNPREAMTPEEAEEQAPSEVNLRLMEGLCLSVGNIITTLGMPLTEESLNDVGARVLLDIVENLFRTVALESREGIPRIPFMRAVADLGTPVALASERTVDIDRAFPTVVPGYRYDRWTRLNDLESFFEDPAVELAMGFRDADYTLPLRCVARDRRCLEKALAYAQALPTYEMARPGMERDGYDDGRIFLDYEVEE